MPDPIVMVQSVRFAYGVRVALDDVTFDVSPGEIFGFLGPNGSGKSTLFRILSTLLPAASGTFRICGFDIATHRDDVRRRIGVVFQSPSLDKQLTARENLTHQGHLYGLRGADLRQRVDEALETIGLADRADEYVQTFSGGMRRRVEVAKGLLHDPRVLLMDEPSTGLDPAARLDLWQHLRRISESGVAVLLTTHLMEEADQCSRLAILRRGKLLACDTPAALKTRVGGDVVTLTSRDLSALKNALQLKLGIDANLLDNTLRFERADAHQVIPQVIEAAPGLVETVSVGKPTLADVFITLTGHRLNQED